MKVEVKLINRRQVKQFALAMAKDSRSHKFTRVGGEFLLKCEGQLKEFIRNYVRRLQPFFVRTIPDARSVNFEQVECVEHITHSFAVHDVVAFQDPCQLKDRLWQSHKEAFAIDSVDGGALLLNEHPASVQLLLHAPVVIINQPGCFSFINRVQQLASHPGRLLFTVPIWRVRFSFRVAFGFFLADDPGEDLRR